MDRHAGHVDWIDHGFFQVTDPSSWSFSQEARLATRLGLAPADLRLRSFPVGPAWRFALVVGISRRLSSWEKGLENLPWLAPDTPRQMDRRSWDWSIFRRRARQILMRDIPGCSQALGRPVSLRLIVIPPEKRSSRER